MEQDTILGSSHGEFTDAPINVLGGTVFGIEAWVAWDSGLDTGGNVGTSTKGEWDISSDFDEHTATGITGGFWFLSDGWISELESRDVAFECGLEDFQLLWVSFAIGSISSLIIGIGFGTTLAKVLVELGIGGFWNGEWREIETKGFLGGSA